MTWEPFGVQLDWCPKGHPYAEYAYYRPSDPTKRRCRECERVGSERRRREMKPIRIGGQPVCRRCGQAKQPGGRCMACSQRVRSRRSAEMLDEIRGLL